MLLTQSGTVSWSITCHTFGHMLGEHPGVVLGARAQTSLQQPQHVEVFEGLKDENVTNHKFIHISLFSAMTYSFKKSFTSQKSYKSTWRNGM